MDMEQLYSCLLYTSSRNTEACITYFKTAFTCFCLVFVLSPDCSVNLRQIILKLHGLFIPVSYTHLVVS